MGLDENIDHLTILIDSSPQILSWTSDRRERFVQVQGVAQASLSSPERPGVFDTGLPTPLSDGFVADCELGFRLPENFAYPYAATNLGEYWRRWHITFSTWLRDYVYFPLGGSHRPHLRVYFNLVVTFLVCGIWHGSRWTFVLWGLAHGVGLAIYKASLDWRRSRGIDLTRRPTRAWLVLGWASTLTFCAFARVPFKSADLMVAAELVHQLARGTAQTGAIDPVVVAVTVLGLGLNFVGRPIFEAMARAHARLPAYAQPLAWVGAGVLMLAFKTREVAPYIYFGF